MNELNPVLQLFIEWMKLTREERFEQGLPLTQQEFAIYNKVSAPQLSNWKKELDLQSAPPSEIAEFMKCVWEGVKAGKNPMWARIYWDIKNPDKKELKEAEFTADEYANIGARVKQELREELERSGGCCPVCGECKSLRHEARLDTKPEHTEDREVATLDLPARPE